MRNSTFNQRADRKKIFTNIFLIILLLAIPVISSPDFDGTLSLFNSEPFQRDFLRFVLVIAFFYLNSLVLLPKLFSRKKILAFSAMVVLSYAVVVFLPFSLVPNHQGTNDGSPQKEMEMRRPPENDRFRNNIPPQFPENRPHPEQMGAKKDNTLPKKIFTSILPFLFSFLSSFFIYKSNEQRELEKLKAKSDLLNLKYQLQPHFLFNILNSIYSLSLLKSDDAPNGILKLSNVMRYVVQESSKDFVDLNKEIDYIKDYIALKLLRTDSSLDFSYTEIGDLKDLKIAPFILINFVENAFKYGFNAEENSKIELKIIVQESILNFTVFNNIVTANITGEDSLKVGLKNTFDQLNQVYSGKHSIRIDETETTYKVDLTINLN
ncbi:sensor histidine kinase [Chryseobacterium caseinilyticum]|uniref:Histidine kinase n=1 Tax=Chryseobacterium caseinilyticum TaxID=2771428 RepID=A0ABR8ZAU3_9FLAO|nr:sensor histidine kinase [Chryseobacterium caseinilyticum]MBD8082347.1 histidine kinase [Chryseobacterium caseinilyticum]